MIHLIYGTQEPLINLEVKKIIKEHLTVIDDFSLIHFDMSEVLLQDIIADAETMPFGIDEKVIVVKNSYIFTGNGPKKDKLEHDIKSLERYIEAENTSTTLIFTSNASKLDEKAKATELIKKAAMIKKINDVGKNDWDVVIKQMITKRNMNFEPKALEEFIDRTKGDLSRVVNELNKLLTYGQKITYDVVDNLVDRPLEDNMFNMVDSILYGKIDRALEIYNDMKLANEDPTMLVPMLANQFRFMYDVKYLSNIGMSEKEIVEELEVSNPVRVSITLKKISRVSDTKLLKMISELADIDYSIKSGQVDKYQAFELFIVSPH